MFLRNQYCDRFMAACMFVSMGGYKVRNPLALYYSMAALHGSTRNMAKFLANRHAKSYLQPMRCAHFKLYCTHSQGVQRGCQWNTILYSLQRAATILCAHGKTIFVHRSGIVIHKHLCRHESLQKLKACLHEEGCFSQRCPLICFSILTWTCHTQHV
jgi:hypothetical protein